MRSFLQDVRYGARLLRASPGFTAVAVLTLALGIAANTTVFSWMDKLLLHPIPGARADSELVVAETIGANGEYFCLSYPDYADYRDRLRLVSGMAAFFTSPLRLGDGDRAQQIWGEFVTGNYFDVLGVKPAIGRFFSREESADPPATPPVAVLGYGLWQSHFRGDRNVTGKTVRINGRVLSVIGVAPANFHGSFAGLYYEFWVPVTMISELNRAAPGMLGQRGTRNMNVVARLKPGLTVEQARAEAVARARDLAAAYPRSNAGVSIAIVPVPEAHMAGAQALLRRPLQVLAGICAVVFLIVCANVANLLLARATARRKEYAIRLSLGAGTRRLARQILTETFLLAGLGAVLGTVLAPWMVDGLVRLLPAVNAPVQFDSGLNGRILLAAIAVCALAALLSGMAPLVCSLRPDLNQMLKEGGRGEKSGGRSHRTRGLLVVSEVALAAVALIGAGLFIKSFQAARGIHPGFDANRVAVARFQLSMTGYSLDQQHDFCLRLRRRLEAAPGIAAATYSDTVPLSFSRGNWDSVEVEGYAPARGTDSIVYRSLVAPGYFDLMRIKRLEGRDFSDRDVADAEPVMIVNETFARRFFGGGNAIGRKIREGKTTYTVVGLVKDSKYNTLTEAPMPFLYRAFRQGYRTGHETLFYIRTAGDPTAALATLRREAAEVDVNAAVQETMPLADYIGACLYPLKVAATMLTVLGALAVSLAAVGLYSVMAYAVSERTHEVGIRMALGAQRRDVLGMVVRQGLALTGAGLAAGIAGALLVTRAAGAMLVNVDGADPVTFAAAAVFLAAVAALASYLPARRATKVDPMVALRCE